MIWKNLLNDFAGLFYPNLCAACSEPLVKHEEVICLRCLANLPRTHFQHDRENIVAQMFWGRVKVEHAAAYLYFQKGGNVQKLLHKLKYKGEKCIGEALGRLMALEMADSLFKNIDLIIPVPLHKSRLRKRGYNQSECIATGIGAGLNVQIMLGLLERVVANPTQTKKHRYDRWTNVEGIFSVKHPEQLSGKHVLLVDDIITTGATLEACTSELLKAGGCSVSIVAVAVA